MLTHLALQITVGVMAATWYCPSKTPVILRDSSTFKEHRAIAALGISCGAHSITAQVPVTFK